MRKTRTLVVAGIAALAMTLPALGSVTAASAASPTTDVVWPGPEGIWPV